MTKNAPSSYLCTQYIETHTVAFVFLRRTYHDYPAGRPLRLPLSQWGVERWAWGTETRPPARPLSPCAVSASPSSGLQPPSALLLQVTLRFEGSS